MNYGDKQRAIERTRKMKTADAQHRALHGSNVEAHGEWALYDKTPRGGTKWTPSVLEKLERTIISKKYNGQPLGLEGLARVAWDMGRSSDAVFQAMLKYDRNLLRHFSLEI